MIAIAGADGAMLGSFQAALNPGRAGLLRAQVAQDVDRIDITYLAPADLAGARPARPEWVQAESGPGLM
ncbi:hypothetical protein [Rhizobium leguminosarum]|uniref:hypothetical protein n=1 Tax=Rhizobium leguminosarum TaxID=384 RepID=UPI001C988AE0|nr:hypothetical protein [Rhizobium leguminosarum]MBY5416392.1 hypothetical protein [Rhizobium leguminosarum]